ncbi:hypothetical protein EKA85_09025 [Pseudomonas veronii]|uniref:hypothetical protein n=1 Tax=Pseudomonas TaxID=286 RepID=UPI000F833165|nr:MULTISPECIES: hypothetical protein [Pseudomonas]MDY7554727.1 hypothetical protein [Pseudomonas sp. FG1]MEB0051486.1 hypothetical protein [Pseudomonas sp. FG1]RTY68688.1 hypothetical protein EKA85_09025 [Pseudomonas veronii]
MSLFKTVDTAELQARKAAAEEQFRGRKSGINHFAGNDPVTGRPVGGYVEGGIEAVLVKYAEDLIPVYIEYTAKGYTLTTIGTVAINANTFEIYFNRPESQVKPMLAAILQKVEDDYKAEIESHNESFIQQQVDAQLRVDAAREEREQAKAAAEKRALVEKQIRETFTAPPATEVVKTTPARGKR